MADSPRIAGVVLAAGRSRRMGRSKALLSLDGETFLGGSVRSLRAGGCCEVIVVVAGHADEAALTASAAGACVCVNPDPASEPIASLRIALRQLGDGVEAVVLAPVDAPGFRPDTVRALVDAFAHRRAAVVLPRYRGARGHPTLFSRETFPALLDPALRGGAREVVRGLGSAVEEVEVDDPAVARDVDTPEAYRRLLADDG
jgi:molybdenum cofactor cytidylyltransferase